MKRDRWIGSAQSYIDVAGHTRGLLIYEREGCYRLIGPLGTTMPMQDRTARTEDKLKRLLEKELRDAGY